MGAEFVWIREHNQWVAAGGGPGQRRDKWRGWMREGRHTGMLQRHTGMPHPRWRRRAPARHPPAIGHLADLAAQRVHLVHQLALGGAAHLAGAGRRGAGRGWVASAAAGSCKHAWCRPAAGHSHRCTHNVLTSQQQAASTHRRVAGLPRDAVQVEGEQQRLGAQARRRQRRLAAGVASAHHHHVVRLLVVPGGRRGSGCWGSRGRRRCRRGAGRARRCSGAGRSRSRGGAGSCCAGAIR